MQNLGNKFYYASYQYVFLDLYHEVSQEIRKLVVRQQLQIGINWLSWW